MTNYTYSQIANSYALWIEFADVDAVTTREQFDNMTEEACIAILTDMFGAEQGEVVEVPDFEVAARDAQSFDTLINAMLPSNEDNNNVEAWQTMTHQQRVESLRNIYFYNVMQR